MSASLENCADLYRLYERDKNRLYFSHGPRSAREVVLSSYTRMYNRFQGENVRLGRHAVHFDYIPDISTPRDAYRMIYTFLWMGKEEHRIEDIAISRNGLAIYLKNEIVIIKVDGDELQRAIIRGKEKTEADMAWYQRPLS